MGARYQGGYLRCVKRKNGSWCWEFLWRENGPLGKQKRRTMRVGSVEEYPTRELAAHAVNGLRMCINAERNRQQQKPMQVCDLIDHYILTELSAKARGTLRQQGLFIENFLSCGSDHIGTRQTFVKFALWRWNTGSVICDVRTKSLCPVQPKQRFAVS